jgi:hypothetical protein
MAVEGRSEVGRTVTMGNYGVHRLTQGAAEVVLIWISSYPRGAHGYPETT